MKQLSKTFAIFVTVDVSNPSAVLPALSGGRHRGEQTGFYPSENLENSKKPEEQCQTCLSIALASEFRKWQNSSERGKRLKAVPPVECIYDCVPMNAAHIHPYRCELILFFLSRVFQNLQTRNVMKEHTSWWNR